MSFPESPVTTTTVTSPLRESTRNVPVAGITPTNSWSTTSTTPLRISRRDLPLTSDSVPNHHYQRLPTQLARRQSSSYNHVKNNSLVSKSPFKVHAAFKPSRIPTPSRLTKEDENKPELCVKRRQSRGLQGLVKEQVVTKSPFLGKTCSAVLDNIPSSPTPVHLPSQLPISHPTPAQDGDPPLGIPCNPRTAVPSRVPSFPSPKPSLVSPKRFHGPRSLSASPGSESGKRQRRKTVTFDERCDVLEFDQDEVSEDVIETDGGEDDYGFPEPPSPIITTPDETLITEQATFTATPEQDLGVLVDSVATQPTRMPRISRDEIRRRLIEQRAEGLEDQSSLSTSQHTPEVSFDLSSRSLNLESSPLSRPRDSSQNHLPNDTLNKDIGAPFNFNEPGVDLDEMHSALDRLMLGVECGFGMDPNEGESISAETAIENDLSANPDLSTVASDLSMDIGEIEVLRQDVRAEHMEFKGVEVPELLSTDEDTDEPITPPLNDRRPSTPDKHEGIPALSFGGSSPSFPILTDASIFPSHEDHSEKESIPPPVPPKDIEVIQQENNTVAASKSHVREECGHDCPARFQEGRPSKRRSLSTGDAEDIGSSNPGAQRRAGRLRDDHKMNLLDIPLEQAVENDALADVIDRELRIRRKPTVKGDNRKYQLRERENTIYASAEDKISHMSGAGDLNVGKAWRTVRRPSDMNEYSLQIKEYRSQQKPGKVHGKVFVKVLGIRGLNVPLPVEPTAFTCTLNNGIHFVTTPECRLGRNSRIEQEFELIEHSKLEFTLTLKVRRDPHIASQGKSNSMPIISTVPPSPTPPSSSRGGVRGFFGVGGSPKKAHKVAVAAAVRATPEPVEDNLARYLKPDGTLARSFISFKEIAKRCDTRLLETNFPLIGQRMDGSSTSTRTNPWTMGELALQIFRLPPLPGILPDQLPQSLEECLRGLRHINWHKVTYHEGVLTQYGGDCRTWRRRLLRVIGSNLVAFNDVTKKATATIDLKKAIGVADDDRASEPITTSPASAGTVRDEFDQVYRVERSFRLIFANDEEITFFADSDEAKTRWLEVFRALVGHIPPNPLWAELIWQRQEELAKVP